MLHAQHGSCHLRWRIQVHWGQDQGHGLGLRNHRLLMYWCSPWEQRGNPPGRSRTRYNGEFDATILLDQLDQPRNLDLHWAFTSPAATIGAAICIFAIGNSGNSAAGPKMTQHLPMQAIAPWTAPAPVQKPANNNWAAQSNSAIPINIIIT